MIESGLYQVVSIETGDDVISGPFDIPLLGVPVLIPHVAHEFGIRAFLPLVGVFPGSMTDNRQLPGEPEKTRDPPRHMADPHLGVTVGPCR